MTDEEKDTDGQFRAKARELALMQIIKKHGEEFDRLCMGIYKRLTGGKRWVNDAK
jgi:hypothetical protein